MHIHQAVHLTDHARVQMRLQFGANGNARNSQLCWILCDGERLNIGTLGCKNAGHAHECSRLIVYPNLDGLLDDFLGTREKPRYGIYPPGAICYES